MTAIKVELELVDGTFTTRMLHAGETIQQFNRNVARSSPALRQMAADGQLVIRSMERAQEAGKGFLSTLRDVSIVATALSVGINKLINIQDTWVGAVVKTNAEFQRLSVMLRGMSDAADPVKDAANQLNGLVDMAKAAPFSLDKITDSFTKLKATGTDPMNGSLKAILDGVAHFGKGGEELQRTVLGISQASGKGVIQMEELRQQIGETMPQAMQLMAASMGVSMSKLVKDISTGRMAAGPALEALYGELDRSFGGSAARMMQTFSGQLARTKTELQGFAQIIGGISKETGLANEGGFFDTVTKQLQAFNDLLGSSGGQVFAQQLGQGLTQVAHWLQVAVEKAIEFRSAISNMIEFGLALAAMKVLGAAINSVGSAYSSVTRSIDMLKLKFADANTMLSAHQAALRNTAIGYESVDRIGAQLGRVTLRAVGAAAISLVPTAAVLGLAIYEVADAFDIFGNRGKEAIATLREFGNVARDQLPKAQKNVDDRQRDLNAEKAQIRYNAEHAVRFGRQKDRSAAIDADIKQAEEAARISERQAEIDNDRFLVKVAQDKQIQEDAKKLAELQLNALDRKTEAEQRAYQVTRENIQKEMDARVAAAKKNGDDIDKIEKERAQKLMDNAKALYETQADDLQQAIAEVWNKAWVGMNGKQGPINLPLTSQLQLDELLKRLDQVREKSNSLRITGVTPDLGATSNSAKQLESLQKAVARTSEDVAGLEDKLHGGNSELGEFLAKLARGAYGNKSADDVKKLSDEMITLLRRKEALQELNKSTDDLQTDIENARLKLVEERVKLEEKQRGRSLTEGEKIQARINAGGYKGLEPNSPAMRALQEATKGLTMQGRVTDALGVSLDRTFGQSATTKITSFNEVLQKTLSIITGIGSGVNGLDFSSLGKGLPTELGTMQQMWNGFAGAAGKVFGGANLMSKHMDIYGDPRSPGWKEANITEIDTDAGKVQVNKLAATAFQGFINELAKSYKITSIGGYNLRNKVSGNSLSEHAFGNAIDINPDANPMGKNLVTDLPPNISALAAKYGLSWGGDWKSAKDAMHFEWRGGSQAPKFDINKPFDIRNPFEGAGASSSDTAAVYQESTDLIKAQTDAKERAKVATDELTKQELALNEANKAQKGDDYATELKRKIDEASESLDGFDKNYRAAQKLIAKDEFGTKSKPNDPLNKQILDYARQLDAAEKARSDRGEASNRIDSTNVKLKEQQVNLEKQINDLKAKAKNPNVKLDSSELVALRTELDKYVNDTATVYGKGTAEYKKALEQRKQSLAQFGQSELLSEVATSRDKTRVIQQGLMTERQARQAAMMNELDEVDQKMAYYRSQGQLDVEATAQFEAQKAAIRQKYAAQDPMTNLMKQWGDLQGNLAKASTQWMDSLAGGLTDLIMGTGDLRSALQGIARDIINMSLKKLMSGFMGNKDGSGAAGAAGKAGKAAKGGTGLFPAAPVGLYHSGGIPGAEALRSRMVNPAMFKNARKFHSGANEFGGRRLLPGEMPAIVKKDEGIFTPEQMKALGPAGGSSTSQQIQINAPVTVNAQGGTHEQNADLAKQMSEQMEATMRGVVVDEIQRQMRPGNILSTGRRK